MLARPVNLTRLDGRCPAARVRIARLRAVPIAALLVIATGCSDDDDGTTATSAADEDAGAVAGEFTIFADESLADAVTDIALAFESEYDDVVPHTKFDASNLLADQIIDGTPADVFVSADAADMDRLADADLNGSEPVVVATNLMTIIVPVGNPADVSGVDDLGDPDLYLALCVPEAPCGLDAQRVLAAAGVTANPAGVAETTAELVVLVENGTADAAIVYATDMTASGDADVVEIPPDLNVLAQYSATVVTTSANVPTAQAFIDFVAGPAGQEILQQQYNFGPP